MSGHSKWSTIKHKKAALDAVRSGEFTKLAREITMAAKLGDKNPDNNPRLRLAILNARKASMPNDNIKRAIDKGSDKNTESYEYVRYEGYGPAAVPIIVEALTDNPRRTVPEVRSAFNKNGGNMGEENSVSFMFTRAGQIFYDMAVGTPDAIMEIAIDAGADDVESSDDGHIITTKPDDFMAVQKALSDKLGEPEKAEITWVPNMPMDISDDDYAKLEKLTDALESNDDVQKVWTAAI